MEEAGKEFVLWLVITLSRAEGIVILELQFVIHDCEKTKQGITNLKSQLTTLKSTE